MTARTPTLWRVVATPVPRGCIPLLQVISFLVLDERSCWSIMFCLQHATQCLQSIVAQAGDDESQSWAGHLRTTVEEKPLQKIVIDELHEFVNDFQGQAQSRIRRGTTGFFFIGSVRCRRPSEEGHHKGER
ncbi:MAG: alpha-E domain-containing protein [Deltaproteobacteria bacterium]|nr:alpha-E domain-containing protein [Deltaproteobacteria bacterium]